MDNVQFDNYTTVKNQIKNDVKDYLSANCFSEVSKFDVYKALVIALKKSIIAGYNSTQQKYEQEDKKQVYYLSIEFLMGRALGNNLINLGYDKIASDILKEYDISLNEIEEVEQNAGLGNGGLGRLAACFLDSMATLGIAGHGCSLKYNYGLFKQTIVDGYQIESPDPWLETGEDWLIARKDKTINVKFGYNEIVQAVPYDMPIIGHGNGVVNYLRLWDAVAPSEFSLTDFIHGDYQQASSAKIAAQALTKVLYPEDSHQQGKELRLRQQYFFVSATLQTVLNDFVNKYSDFNLLPEKVQFQLNDTHPTVAVAELMRLLVDEYGVNWDSAWEITKNTCAYTNHTILSEALEKWDVNLFKNLLPRVYEVIEEINKRFCKELIDMHYAPDIIRRMAIVADGQIKMAWLAIVGSHSVNGVAALHTKILKERELNDFYKLYPDKFNNKTNGITQRRWLLKSNPELAQLITDAIGNKWITDLPQLKNLEDYIDNKEFLCKISEIKFNNKVKLAAYIKENNGVEIDPNSIFDIQIKRLHEYKRALMNALHIIYLYTKIKTDNSFNMHPHTFIFAAKAAPGYKMAKKIIKLINTVADIVNNDVDVSKKMKIVFLENYNVSVAEMLFRAADVSEQISTASLEASGTGNMKFMLNGALTIGTMDGANVEIVEEAGIENEFIFGLSAQEVIEFQKNKSYDPMQIYQNDFVIKSVLDSIINGNTFSCKDVFNDIHSSLINHDTYFVLKDFHSYKEAHERISDEYKNKEAWAKKALINIANSGKFSSDRTILEYAQDIWKV